MKYLIVGLGNPGAEYEQTRHNIGFLVLDFLAQKAGVSFLSDRYGHIAQTRFKNKQALLLKPNTFMNLSGKAVRYWMQQFQVPLENIIIVLDDLALPLGKLRIRTKGSDGGHNGLKSIDSLLNSQNYTRLRFGIGNDFGKGQQVDFVLGEWTAEEKKMLNKRIELAAEAIQSFVLSGPEQTMGKYNAL